MGVAGHPHVRRGQDEGGVEGLVVGQLVDHLAEPLDVGGHDAGGDGRGPALRQAQQVGRTG